MNRMRVVVEWLAYCDRPDATPFIPSYQFSLNCASYSTSSP